MDINIFNKIYSSIIDGNKNIRSALTKIQLILSNETRESNEMLKIYQKYITNNESITKEELEQANKQFSDLLKGLGLAGVFALPGGLLAIAFIVKVGEKLGIDIIPDKYRK
jgi:phosphosulfolactate synthase (CoM biosynthesis protein A)